MNDKTERIDTSVEISAAERNAVAGQAGGRLSKFRMTVRSVARWSVFIAMQTCVVGLSSAASPVIDSGAWVRSGGNPVIYWIDDHRALFVGLEGIKPTPERDATSALLQWEIGKSVSVLRRGVDSLCYRPGQIRYAVLDREAKKRTYYQGELGNEKQIQPKGNDELNCDWMYESQAKSTNRMIRNLFPGHGQLNLGPAYGKESLENVRVKHIAAGDRKETELPFGSRELSGGLRYYPFKGAYFVRLAYFDPVQKGSTTTWPPGQPQKAYWLWPDGRTELVEFPSDIGDPQPSRLGIAYRVTASDQSKNGVYHLTNGERRLLVRGYVAEMSMSPDGCRLAFSYAPDAKSNVSTSRNVSLRTLKAVDLCSGRREAKGKEDA